MEGSQYCFIHSGTVDRSHEREVRMYQLAEVKNRERLSNFADDNQIKSLREEIGLCRLLIEKRVNLIKDDADLIASCGALNQLFLTLERLIKSCHGLDISLGELLSKETVMQLAQRLVAIIMEELSEVEGHEAIIDRIVSRMTPTISHANNETLALPAPE
jgi:hypothetical protein